MRGKYNNLKLNGLLTHDLKWNYSEAENNEIKKSNLFPRNVQLCDVYIMIYIWIIKNIKYNKICLRCNV